MIDCEFDDDNSTPDYLSKNTKQIILNHEQLNNMYVLLMLRL